MVKKLEEPLAFMRKWEEILVAEAAMAEASGGTGAAGVMRGE